MSNVEAFTDEIKPFNGTSISLYSTAINAVVPNTNDILTASSGTAGSWQTGVSAIKTTGDPVVVSGSNPATAGQVLKASSSTVASWVDFSSSNKASVRAATTQNGTLASDFENGDIIDGVTLVTGDRILIKDQGTGTENGIYEVQATGAPVRTSDISVGESISGIFLFVQEGTINRDIGYLCTSSSGNDVVGTDALTFQIFSGNAGGKVLVNTLNDIKRAVVDGAKHIQIASGTYPVDQIIINQNDITFEGLGNVIFQYTSIADILSIDGVDNITIKNITVDGDNTGNGILISNTCSNIIINQCKLINAGNTDNISINATGIVDGLTIKNCSFQDRQANSLAIFIGDEISNTIISGCYFNSSTATDGHITLLGTNIIVKECFFETGAATAITINDATNNVQSVIITDCMFREQTTSSITVATTAANAGPVIISNCHFDNTSNIIANERVLIQGCHISDITTTSYIVLNTANSSYSSIVNNAFLNQNFWYIQIGANSDNNLISDNTFEITNVSNEHFVQFDNISSIPYTRITRNNAILLFDITEINLNYSAEFDAFIVKSTGTTGNTEIFLEDLPRGSFGHYIAFSVTLGIGDDFLITPNNTTQSEGTSYTSIQYNNGSETETTSLQWTGRGWKIFYNGTAELIP